MLYNLSSFSASVSGWGGCVYSAKSFFKCISPNCTWDDEPEASEGSADVEADAPRNLRIKFILRNKSYASIKTYFWNRNSLLYWMYSFFLFSRHISRIKIIPTLHISIKQIQALIVHMFYNLFKLDFYFVLF